LACNAPQLWNWIRIDEALEADTLDFDATLQLRIPHFLTLFNACPLQLSITTYSWVRHLGADARPDDPFCANLDRFRERLRMLSALIAPHLARVKILDIVYDESYVPADLSSNVPGYVAMPLLEVLQICNMNEHETMNDDLDHPEDAQALTILLRPPEGAVAENAAVELYPRLQSVTLHSVPLDWNLFCARNLVELKLGYLARNARPADAVMRRILSESKDSLRSLSLAACLVGEQSSDEGREVVTWDPLPELEYLAVGFTHPREAIPCLSAIQVPKIEGLQAERH